MASISIRRLALFAVPFFLRLARATQQCYNPDGTESSDVPCSSDDTYQTFCCASGATCILDPGPLCQVNGDYVRGTCTVQDWSSGACPLFCIADNSDTPVDRCTAQVSNGNFCCGYDADKDLCSCATNNNTFPLYAYTSIKVAQTAASTSSSSSSSATSSPSSAATAGTATTAGASSATGGKQTATAATTGTSPTSTAAASSSGMTTGAKIGVGVAVPLGVIAIGALAFLAWRMRKKNNAAKANYPAELPPHGHQGYYDPPPNEVKYAHEGTVGGYGAGGGYSSGVQHQQAPSEMYAPSPGEQHQAYEMPTSPGHK